MSYISKDEFYQAAMKELGNYPALQERIAMGDVTITQRIGAQAMMLSMLSLETSLGIAEFWTRSRQSMVFADAAQRQILPFAAPKILKLTVRNDSAVNLVIQAGRRLLDSRSRLWVVRDGVSVSAGKTATLTATQYNETSFIHEVNETKSFYSIAIPEPQPNQALVAIQVIHVNDKHVFKHIERFNNIEPNDKVFHISANELLNLSIQFGLRDKFGYTPNVGEQFRIVLQQSFYDFEVATGDQFSLEYTSNNEELLKFFALEEIQKGTPPASISELRELVKYPFLYDENAVFLGEFSQLIARKMRPFVFLSVWNEFIEEKVRGAKLENINTLFVSYIKENISTAEAQQQIRNVIQGADDSYRVKFVAAREIKVGVAATIWLSPMYDAAAVKNKVRLWLLQQFGKKSEWARRGGQRINVSETISIIKESIKELQGTTGDLTLAITDSQLNLPEAFRFVDDSTLTITINMMPI